MKNITVCFLLLALSITVLSQDKHKHKHHKRFLYPGKPAVELTYGFAKEDIKDVNGFDREFGMAELKLGYFYSGKSVYSGKISRLRNTYLYGQYISPSIKFSEPVSDADPVWKFGFGTSEGYGHINAPNSSFSLYNSNALSWTSFPDNYFLRLTGELPENTPDLTTFGESIRFGNMTEAVISVPVVSGININAKYERSLVYPRHLFWKWLGSMIIEAGAQSAVDEFVKAIMRSSPAAGPVMNFLLKNGLAYGIYELRKGKMNWPFSSDKPLSFDSFKLGVNIVF